MKRHIKLIPIMALAVCISTFFSACEKEADPMVRTEASVKTYESIKAELDKVNGEIKSITDQYPNFKLEVGEISKVGPEKVTAKNFEAAISGINNTSDKNRLADLYLEVTKLDGELIDHSIPDIDGVFTVVEEQPAPEGGMKEFYKYVQQNLSYPEQARRMGIEGKVFVQFIVNEDGSLSNFQTLKGIGAGCDDEAVRVLENAASWTPGYQKGQPVKVKMVLPITYSLSDGKTSLLEIPDSDTENKLLANVKPLPKIQVAGYRN